MKQRRAGLQKDSSDQPFRLSQKKKCNNSSEILWIEGGRRGRWSATVPPSLIWSRVDFLGIEELFGPPGSLKQLSKSEVKKSAAGKLVPWREVERFTRIEIKDSIPREAVV